MTAIPGNGNGNGNSSKDDFNDRAINHQPFGFEAPYSVGPDERTPRRPQENQLVKLGVTTPVQNSLATVQCYWRLNGVTQAPITLYKTGLAHC